MPSQTNDARLAQRVEMQSAKVLRWRFAFNLALMFFDGLVYFCIGLLVMYVSDGMQIVTTRLQLNMHINVYL